jgi:hypothetical protein
MIARLLSWLVKPSDIVVGGSLYMRRWIFLLWRGGPAIRVHHILRPDGDRALHDHPFTFLSIILRGIYLEERPAAQANWLHLVKATPERVETVRSLYNFARAEQLHRISMISEGGVWTLVFAGPKRRHWGFLTEDRGWVPWEQFEPQAGTWDTKQKQLEQARRQG